MPLRAGSEIDAWCTKCRMDLGHRVVAMVEGRPKRVICLTCNSEHNYRPPLAERQEARRAKPARGAGGTARAKKVSARAQSELDRVSEWETRTRSQDRDAFTRYSMDRTFDKDELVAHKKFGEGYVIEAGDGKVAIMFRDGRRTLAQGQR